MEDDETPEISDPSDAVEFAWKVYDALDSSTAKVDSKASIVLAIEGALVGFVIALSGRGGRLSGLRGYRVSLDRLGLGFVALSVILSLAVVMPQLGRRTARRRWSSNMIYFGHLRRWSPEQLAADIARIPTLPQLARQLVTMSKISWRKHAWLQWSLICLVAGSGLLVWAAR